MGQAMAISWTRPERLGAVTARISCRLLSSSTLDTLSHVGPEYRTVGHRKISHLSAQTSLHMAAFHQGPKKKGIDSKRQQKPWRAAGTFEILCTSAR
jgi:hypothetical protein